MKLLSKINRILKMKKLKVPECSYDNRFIYCYCGKCKPKDCELPKDFQKLLIIKVVEEYEKNKSR